MDLEAIVVPDFLSDLFACLSSYKQGLTQEAYEVATDKPAQRLIPGVVKASLFDFVMIKTFWVK